MLREPRALRPQARALRLAAREPVRGQRRHVRSLRLRGNTKACYNIVRLDGDSGVGGAQVPVPRHGDADRLRAVHGVVLQVRLSGPRGGTEIAERLPRAVVLVDGEHYPPVVAAALEGLRRRFEVVGGLFAGGREKLRGGEEQAPGGARRGARACRGSTASIPARRAGRALDGTRAALRAARAEALVDLSDEPVVGYRERFLLMSAALAEGARYVAADTEVRPQDFARLERLPALGVIGTGKRVGKTAVSGWLARRLDAALARARRRDRAGHGPRRPARARAGAGPRGPRRSRAARGLPPRPARRQRLLRGRRAGRRHDHRLPALRRRAGRRAVRRHRARGAAAAWRAVRRRPGRHRGQRLRGAAGGVRRRGVRGRRPRSRSTTSPACSAPTACCSATCSCSRSARRRSPTALAWRALAEAARAVRPGLRVVPDGVQAAAGAVGARPPRRLLHDGARGPPCRVLARALADDHGAEVVLVSADLADRGAPGADVARAAREADVFLCEIKAAAVDVVAEAAAAAGRELVFCDNEPRGPRAATSERSSTTWRALRRSASPSAAGSHGAREGARERPRRQAERTPPTIRRSARASWRRTLTPPAWRRSAPTSWSPRSSGACGVARDAAAHPRRPARRGLPRARAAGGRSCSSSGSASGRRCGASRLRSSSSSAAPPASARARWPPSSPTVSASLASSAPTWSARPCAPSSPPS